jgi:hypothetical protein
VTSTERLRRADRSTEVRCSALSTRLRRPLCRSDVKAIAKLMYLGFGGCRLCGWRQVKWPLGFPLPLCAGLSERRVRDILCSHQAKAFPSVPACCKVEDQISGRPLTITVLSKVG